MKLYSILNITDPNVSDKIIKRNYLLLAKKYHPDKGGDQNKFKEIQSSYEILSNPNYRNIYNKTGESNINNIKKYIQNEIQKHFTLGDNPPSKKIKININIKQSFVGIQKNINITDTFYCHQCMGLSYINHSNCYNCNNTGLITNTLNIPINIPAGINNKNEIILKEIGGNTWGYRNKRNIILIVNVESDPIFKRKKNNIHLICNITLKDALCGFKKQIIHLDGKKITIDNNQIIPIGYKKIIPNIGFKILNSKYEYTGKNGDMIIDFNINMPDKITDEFKKACEKYLK
jgi:DnaJ-class molecular chaperone